MLSRRQIDLLGGLMVIAIGVFVLLLAPRYGIGPISRMRGGNFPQILGVVSVLLGAAIALSALVSRPAEGERDGGKVPWRAIACVSASIAAFAIGVPRIGFLPSVGLATVLAAMGDSESTPLQVAALVAFTLVFVWLVFSVGFGMIVPLFRWNF